MARKSLTEDCYQNNANHQITTTEWTQNITKIIKRSRVNHYFIVNSVYGCGWFHILMCFWFILIVAIVEISKIRAIKDAEFNVLNGYGHPIYSL